MIVTETDGLYAAQYVTGPKHNLLWLRLANGPQRPFSVTVLPSIGDGQHHNDLTANEVIPAICAGVGRANKELGTEFAVEHAEIVADDSNCPAVYEILARQIVRKAAEHLD